MTEPFGWGAVANGLATATGVGRPIADHAAAFVELLQQAIDRIEAGQGVPEVAESMLLPVRIAARRV
jgi:hypothetical protein